MIPVKLIDVAGLVIGASEGRGLGNRFLDDLRQADALIHVVDASGSTNEEGRLCPQGSHNPLMDVEFVEKEFDLWVVEKLRKEWPRMSRSAESGVGRLTDMLAEKLSGLSIKESQILEAFEESGLKPEKPTSWSNEELFRFCKALREIAKPALIAANKCDLSASFGYVKRLKETGRMVIPCASEAELLLRRAAEKGLIRYLPGDSSFTIPDSSKLTPEQRKALSLVEDKVFKNWGSTGVQQCINSVYLELLKGIVVYPVEDESRLSDKKGNILPDAYVVKKSSTARDLAYLIHSDLGETFLYAIDAKRGVRVGGDYQLQHSDVIKIVATAKRG